MALSSATSSNSSESSSAERPSAKRARHEADDASLDLLGVHSAGAAVEVPAPDLCGLPAPAAEFAEEVQQQEAQCSEAGASEPSAEQRTRTFARVEGQWALSVLFEGTCCPALLASAASPAMSEQPLRNLLLHCFDEFVRELIDSIAACMQLKCRNPYAPAWTGLWSHAALQVARPHTLAAALTAMTQQ